jgi:hypothetical protein
VVLRLGRCCAAEAWPAVERATAAELRALALEVELVSLPAGKPTRTRHALAALARRHQACGALRIARRRRRPDPRDGSGGGNGARTSGQPPEIVSVTLLDRATGKSSYRDLPRPAGKDAANLVALRVVELLRASLLELRMAGRRPRPRLPGSVARLVNDIPVEPVGEGPDRRGDGAGPRRRPGGERPPGVRRGGPGSPGGSGRHGLRLDLTAVGSPGEIGALGQLGLAYRYRALGWLSLELTAATSVVRGELSYDGIGSTFDVAVLAGWLCWEWPALGRLRASFGVGGGVAVPWAVGQPNPRYAAGRDASLSGYVGAALQAAVVLTPRLWLRLGFEAGAALPEIRVQYGGRTVARFGQPLLAGHVGLELRLPP